MTSKTLALVGLLLGILMLTTACGGYPRLEEIGPNETAFLVPLTGASKDDQGKFMSVDFLKESKVATKRVEIPLVKHETGWMPYFGYQWVDAVRLIKVDRTPVTREWTASSTTGTSKGDQSIAVESSNSINFHSGAVISAMITEADAATYLYYFSSQPLSITVDTNIRGDAQALLSYAFGKCPLGTSASSEDTDCRIQKGKIFGEVFKALKEKYGPMGITITNFGNSGGMDYDIKAIQDAIDQVFIAQQQVEVARQSKLAQDEINAKNVTTSIAERQAADEFAKAKEAAMARTQLQNETTRAQAMLEFAKKFDGRLPQNVVPEGSPFLYGFGGNGNK